MMLHKYNNSLTTNRFSLNTNSIDDFDQNLYYNSMYQQHTKSFHSTSTIEEPPLLNSRRSSSVTSLNSLNSIEKSSPKKKDQSWLLLLIVGA